MTLESPDQLNALIGVLSHKVALSVTQGSVSPLVSYLYENMRMTQRRVAPDAQCRSGCSYCCHTWVAATAPEILYLAKSVKAADRESIAAAAAAIAPIDFVQRLAQPFACPFLKDSLCSAYGVRPLTCRSAFSADADRCRRIFSEMSGESVPVPVSSFHYKLIYSLALAAALESARLPTDLIELNGGLQVALETPEAERRWLEGEDIFADVQRDPGSWLVPES